MIEITSFCCSIPNYFMLKQHFSWAPLNMPIFSGGLHEKVLDCRDLVDVLVDVDLHRMTEDYRIYIENLSFSSFSKLMGVSEEQSAKRNSRSSSLIRSTLKKRICLQPLRKAKGLRIPVQRRYPMERESHTTSSHTTLALRGEESRSSLWAVGERSIYLAGRDGIPS